MAAPDQSRWHTGSFSDENCLSDAEKSIYDYEIKTQNPSLLKCSGKYSRNQYNKFFESRHPVQGDMGNSWNSWTNSKAPTRSYELPESNEESPAKKRKLSDGRGVLSKAGYYEDISQLCQEKERKIQLLQSEIQRIKNDMISKEEYSSLKRKYQEERTAKDDALRRLSAIASSKLRNNNPNIADLSDQNRPTKIAEKLSELYDNQWTDAYDAFQRKQMKEEDIIELLRDLIMRAYRICKSIASEKYFEKVQRSIELPIQDFSVPKVSVLPDSLKQQIKEFRKLRAVHVIKDLEKAIKYELKPAPSNLEAVQTYVSSCIEISWLMAVQDPPLVLSTDVSLKFDTNHFKHYTRRGKYVEYVVWPALYLCEGGAVLAKGVAQGCDHSR